MKDAISQVMQQQARGDKDTPLNLNVPQFKDRQPLHHPIEPRSMDAWLIELMLEFMETNGFIATANMLRAETGMVRLFSLLHQTRRRPLTTTTFM